MSYLLRNDDMYTVRVSWTHRRTYLCEVHHGLDRLVYREFNPQDGENASDCLQLASRFVDHHISSLYLWSLVNDSTSPPVVHPKTEAYTERCRRMVEALYGGIR